MKVEPKIFEYKDHTVIFRNAVEKDAELVHDLLTKLYSESIFLAKAPEEADTVKDIAKKIKSFLDSDRGCYILAFVDAEPAGFCYIKNARSYKSAKHRASLGIGIVEEFTNQGFGEQLISFLIEIAKKNMFTQIELHVNDKNQRAIHLYEKLGFVEYGHLQNAVIFDGTVYGQLSMIKQL